MTRKPVKFILIYGWSWALACFLLVTMYEHLFKHQPLTLSHTTFDLISWLLAGLVFGFLTWRQSKSKIDSAHPN